MFSFRSSSEATAPDGTSRRVEVAFTDSTVDLQGLRPDFPEVLGELEGHTGVRFARLNQVHGDEVVHAVAPMELGDSPQGDALVATRAGLGLMIRVADCVPVLLADPSAGVIGAVHSGRAGTMLDIAARTVTAMREQGAEQITAWIGPHVCGSCYEVPEAMQREVAATVPGSRATTSWGTPALDLGAGVRGQLERAGVEVLHIGGCTFEDPSLYSYRRDGGEAGRLAGLVWMS